MQKLAMNTASYACAVAARMPSATSGPVKAPMVSIIRWTPNARPYRGGGVDSVISASRGAVRRPLPVRSIAITAPIAPTALPAASSPSLATADSP